MYMEGSYEYDHDDHKMKKRKRRRTPSSPGSSASSSFSGDVTEEEEDMANCLILLAQGHNHQNIYECKTCNRSFASFQALGGHRASHKKPKPDDKKPAVAVAVAADRSDHDHDQDQDSREHSGKSNKVHECSVCGAEFASGQALGGHMRRHRAAAAPPSLLRRDDDGNILHLDLNLPAPEDDFHRSNSEFSFVFSAAPALVDCHY